MTRHILCCKKENGRLIGCFIDFDDIYRISKEAKDTVFYTKDGAVYYDVSTLADYHDCLNDDGFDFINRSELVRVDKIVELDARITAQKVVFEGGELAAPVADAYIKKIKKLPGIHVTEDVKTSFRSFYRKK